MNIKDSDADSHKSLQILDELSHNESLTQRDLSKRLGVALGLVNSYLKHLIAKGYVTVKNIPSRRYAYYLTPKGFTEKTRLAYDLLHDYTRIYREARQNLKKLFIDLQDVGANKIVFAGVDEVAEIAYLTLQETSLELVAVMDAERAGGNFFSKVVRPVSAIKDIAHDRVVVTAYQKKDEVFRELLENGVRTQDILSIFPLMQRGIDE